MSRIPLTDAMVDSHKITLSIHLNAAERCIEQDQWNAAKLALQMALPHANAIGNREIKRKVFSALNVARHRAKAEQHDSHVLAQFVDENVRRYGSAQ